MQIRATHGQISYDNMFPDPLVFFIFASQTRFSTMEGKFSPWTTHILSTLIASSLRERALFTVVRLSPLQSPLSSCIDDNDTGSIHFLQTGSRQGADAILRPGFEIEDLAGRCLMPGFIGDSRSSCTYTNWPFLGTFKCHKIKLVLSFMFKSSSFHLSDPHIHPSMAAVILSMHFITPFDWRLPGWYSKSPWNQKVMIIVQCDVHCAWGIKLEKERRPKFTTDPPSLSQAGRWWGSGEKLSTSERRFMPQMKIFLISCFCTF